MTFDGAGVAARRRVLFVEGEPSLRKNVASHLFDLGLEVVTVADGDEALDLLRHWRADLVCIDINLPRASGYEMCEEVRSDARLAGVRILMTCDRASAEARAHSFEAGADAHLTKPYSLGRLTKEILGLLSSGPSERERELEAELESEEELKIA